MKMKVYRIELRGGSANGLSMLFVRPPEFQVLPDAIGCQVGDGQPSCYEFADNGPEPGSMVYAFAGPIPLEDADADDVEVARQWAERWEETEQFDGAKRHKTRVFFDGGPVDGAFLFLLYPPELRMVGLELQMKLDDDQAGAGREHVYEAVPSWQESGENGPDVMVFRHSEIKRADAPVAAEMK